MAYTIQKSDGSQITISDGTIDTSQYSINLIGDNALDYGAAAAENWIYLLENFADDTAPSNATRGQIWYDSNAQTLKVWSGSLWQTVMTTDTSGNFNFNDDVVFGGDVTVNGNLMPGQDCSSGVGSDIGSSSLRFCDIYAVTFHGTATAATYSDLAERMQADEPYPVGTIVEIGGDKEITASDKDLSTDVYGVVSDKPGLMLNALAGPSETHPYIGLSGKVSIRISGLVSKGDRIVSSSTPGVGVAYRGDIKDLHWSQVVGRALESKDSEGEALVHSVLGK